LRRCIASWDWKLWAAAAVLTRGISEP